MIQTNTTGVRVNKKTETAENRHFLSGDKMTDVPKWASDKVELWPIEKLKPYEHNARTHDAGQVAKLADSIREYGWTIPVLVDDTGVILAGHGRVQAATFLGMKQVPVMIANGWDETKKRAYVFADNRLAEMSDWNNEVLAAEIRALMVGDFGISTLGFNLAEINSLLSSPEEIEQLGKMKSGIEGQKRNETLRFGRFMVPLTNEEFAWLEAKAQAHHNLYGASVDFVGSTLNGTR
jgi:ParB-like chromosome segregation protein Spo0J